MAVFVVVKNRMSLKILLLDLCDSLDRGDIVFDRLVIECTGMADPGPITQTFFFS